MRDVIFTLIMAPLLPACFMNPWIGVLVWSWLGYMNPHQHCYGFAKWSVPWAQMVAVSTLLGLFLTKDRKPFILSRESASMLALWAWFTVTTFFAWDESDAWWQWARVSKIILMTLVTIPLFQDRNRLRWLIMVIAASFGFYGLKAGLFVFATGGNYMVFGAPGDTFVSQNNTIALALNMCLPLFWYLYKTETRRWLRNTWLATFLSSIVAVPFTYSRGGVLGLGVVLSVLFVRSRFRYLAFPALLGAVLVLFAWAPEKWVERMNTMRTYDHDASAQSRLIAWEVGYKIARDSPLVGGGFWVFNQPETYQRYAPGYPSFVDAHSIYFNLLGEHGFVGLGLFLLMAFLSLATLLRIYRVCRWYPEMAWARDYAHTLGASIIAYLVTGAFLSVSYFDLAYHFFVIVVLLRYLTDRELVALSPLAARAAGAGSRVIRSSLEPAGAYARAPLGRDRAQPVVSPPVVSP